MGDKGLEYVPNSGFTFIEVDEVEAGVSGTINPPLGKPAAELGLSCCGCVSVDKPVLTTPHDV